ncbi:transcriptional regulator [Solemya elarraichensis gill symbiont]|uniref:UPF0250 protein BOW52_05250 n=2 Tax=Solemya elarraichensis gill symbiont TaxID=1918949 RepID=A0A1T2L6W8_9GAMM|nr:transcriptional regulator [Solemya elarraichensis gill symbiont]
MNQETNEIMQYPCEIAIKAMGKHEPGFEEVVVEIVARHVGELDNGCVSCRPSKGDNFLAVTIRVQAESREQMDRIYHELTAHERVSLAL